MSLFQNPSGLPAPPSIQCLGLCVPNSIPETQRVLDRVLSEIRGLGYDREEEFAIRLSLDEALANAVKHGNRRDPAKHVHVDYVIDSAHVWIRVRDEGPGFEPDSLPDPRLPENVLKPSGRGVMLMRHYMTRVEFHPPGNCVEMMRVRAGRCAAG